MVSITLHALSYMTQLTYFERNAVLRGRLVLLAPVNAEVDVDFSKTLKKPRDIRLSTVLADSATWRRGRTTQPGLPQHTVQPLPRLLVLGLDV